MNFQTLPVKRRPAPKGISRRLSAVTRKQRVAATANAADFDDDDGGSKTARSLIIIFFSHIVVLCLVFIHIHFLASRQSDVVESAKPATADTAPVVIVAHSVTPAVPSADVPYIVKPDDTYARIAAAAGVDEGTLRLLNQHASIAPGTILKLPLPRLADTAAAPIEPTHPVVATSRSHTPPDHGLVDAVDVNAAPKARAVHANALGDAPAHAAATPSAAASRKTYVVQQGDSIWGIAHHSKVSQAVLLRANGISDARKIKPGMKLIIPPKEKI